MTKPEEGQKRDLNINSMLNKIKIMRRAMLPRGSARTVVVESTFVDILKECGAHTHGDDPRESEALVGTRQLKRPHFGEWLHHRLY